MQPLKAIFFDLDETLLDDNASYRLSLARAFEELAAGFPHLDLAGLPHAYTSISDAHWGGAEGKVVRAPSGALDGNSIRRELWKLALAKCGCDDEAVAAASLQAYARCRRESYRLFDDVIETLDALRDRHRLVVITNGPGDTQREKLEATGIASHFDVIVTSGEAGYAKPDPMAFQVALDALSLAPHEALHVGDSLANDVAGARAAGLRAVWLNRTAAVRAPHHAEPHHEIASLRELLGLLM
jgi:2-haloalkanoic acid dehalogenase type II